MTDKQKITVLLNALNIVKEDAEMALDGNWDKSDEGFQDQIDFINKTIESLDKPFSEQLKLF